MAGDVCDVCGGQSVGVASAATVAMSYAYCGRCANEGLMPWGELVTLEFTVGTEDLVEGMDDIIIRSLKMHDKTMEDLKEEGRRLEELYIQQMEMEALEDYKRIPPNLTVPTDAFPFVRGKGKPRLYPLEDDQPILENRGWRAYVSDEEYQHRLNNITPPEAHTEED